MYNAIILSPDDIIKSDITWLIQRKKNGGN